MYENNSNKAEMMNLPGFLGDLDPNNRWVKLANLIPWNLIDEIYSKNFQSHTGPKALPSRIAFGSLIIQQKLNLTDEETVNQITENPYLQYFIGLEYFQNVAPFTTSMMTIFRKRIKLDDIKEIAQHLYEENRSSQSDNDDSDDNDTTPPESGDIVEKLKGKLVVDASCAPADIHFPTDLRLLHYARIKSETILDSLWNNRTNKEQKTKPRSYRKKGQRAFAAILKQKRPGKKKVRNAIRIQLSCLRRNLQTIDKLKEHCNLLILKKSVYKDLLVIHTLYEQQQEMFDTKTKKVNDRIVSISQPHVRPIVRGKAGAKTEFGAKFSISVIDGWNFIDTVSFDAYNEGNELIGQIEAYKKRTGFYPKSVHADHIYRNRKNRKYCSERKIRLSGPALGRPSKDAEKLKAQREQEYADQGARNIVEGRFGIGKRRYGLNKIMTKLKSTSETMIALIILVMNLDRCVQIFCTLFFIDHFDEIYEKISYLFIKKSLKLEFGSNIIKFQSCC